MTFIVRLMLKPFDIGISVIGALSSNGEVFNAKVISSTNKQEVHEFLQEVIEGTDTHPRDQVLVLDNHTVSKTVEGTIARLNQFDICFSVFRHITATSSPTI